jgi:hypothetical protein
VARDNRRNTRIPKKRDAKKITKDYSWNRYDSTKKMLNSYPEAINEWAPKNWTNASPDIRLARINKSTISIESLIDKFANRSIHCSIRVDESFFNCSFIGNQEGSEKRMREELEVIRNQERKKNQRETGFFETNQEQQQRIQREKIEAEEEMKRLQFESMVSEMRNKFQTNPHSRFDHIKMLGDKYNYQTTYVIELSKSVISSGFQRAYPSKEFPENEFHSAESRCFYVGMTWHRMEERFHLAEANHMWNKYGGKRAGVVRRHRQITDSKPFEKSIKSLHELTRMYGYENEQRQGRVKSDRFEHYVAYALYMCGFRTWGPKFSDLSSNFSNMKWLGEYPFI